jgi:hypothetical protein
MAESTKVLSSRIVQKHDIETNWLKATTFIPKLGEIIVYDNDENYDYERFKIGDGQTIVGSLPFAVDDHCGIVRKEGNVAFAKSLEGLTIGVTSNINFIQSGEGNASADNVRPITGWDTVSVTRTGKNVFGGMKLAETIQALEPGSVVINETDKTVFYRS